MKKEQQYKDTPVPKTEEQKNSQKLRKWVNILAIFPWVMYN